MRTPLQISLRAFFCQLLWLVALPAIAQTQPPVASGAEASLSRPTDFRTRAEIRNEYQALYAKGYRNLTIPRLEYALRPDLALRLETPYVVYDAGTRAERVSGQGDVLVRAAWRSMQREGFALILATDVIADTAEDARLGAGKTIVAPHVYAAIDWPAANSVFFPNIQHYSSVAGDDRRSEVNLTTLKPNLLTRWPNRVYTFLEPQFTVDWARNAKTGLTVELEIGKILHKHIAAWVRPGIGVINRNVVQTVYEWNLEIGARYVF